MKIVEEEFSSVSREEWAAWFIHMKKIEEE
jgi:hypothetical protein